MSEVVEFILRRFPNDVESRWLTGNCYYFAVILKSRFGGTILYDVVDGHFVTEIEGVKYDWSGIVTDDDNHRYVPWDDFEKYDPQRRQRVVEGCIN